MPREKPISLAPLKFKEAVADLLKVKPPPPRPNSAKKIKAATSKRESKATK